jgi:hypothetical protein
MKITIRNLKKALDYVENNEYLRSANYCTNCECIVSSNTEVDNEGEETGNFYCLSCFFQVSTGAFRYLEIGLNVLLCKEIIDSNLNNILLSIFAKIKEIKKPFNTPTK